MHSCPLPPRDDAVALLGRPLAAPVVWTCAGVLVVGACAARLLLPAVPAAAVTASGALVATAAATGVLGPRRCSCSVRRAVMAAVAHVGVLLTAWNLAG